MHDHEKKQAIAIINKLRQDLQHNADSRDISLDALAQLDEIKKLVGRRPDADTEAILKRVAYRSKNFNDELKNFMYKLHSIRGKVETGFYSSVINYNEINQYYKETLKTAIEEFNVFYKKYYNQLDVAEIVLENYHKSISASLIVDDVVNNLTKDMENEDE